MVDIILYVICVLFGLLLGIFILLAADVFATMKLKKRGGVTDG